MTAAGPATPAAREPVPLLELEGVDASYGPYRALFEVSMSVSAGAVVALVGPNGSGKSTVARVVSGLVRPTRGRVRFDGRDVTGWPAWRIARAGLLHAPEGRPVFASLTVEENLLLSLEHAAGRRGLAGALERAYASFPRLRERRHQEAGTLSGGEQRMLTLARVLAVPSQLLVVDELSLGLSPAMVDEVFGALRRVHEAGTAILVVEQHVDRAVELATRVVALAQGRVVGAGTPAALATVLSELVPARATPPGRAEERRQRPTG